MRRLTLGVAAMVVLATAGLAVAKGLADTKGIKTVAGTFTATTVEQRGKERTCRTTDGKTIVTKNARYRGTAAGDADLAGAITIDARSVVNTTDNVGVVEGRLRVDVASGGDTVARFSAVYDRGKLVGLATGHVQEPHARLFANVSASFAAGSGFTGGKIGAADGGSAVEVAPGRCAPGTSSSSDTNQGTRGKGRGKND
jgi:hypothetical protein